MNPNITRRQAIALTAAGVAAAVLPAQSADTKQTRPIPKRMLGRTGVEIPIICFGGGTRFFTFYTPETAVAALNQALAAGITYFDTANSYGDGKSEKLFAPFVKARRKEIFLVTKLKERTADGAMRQFEESLKRLQTDHVDLLHVHRIDNDEDLAKIEAKGGVLEAYYKLREQKVARHIGITAHADPQPLKNAIEHNDFDCVQMPLNAALSGVSLAGFKPPHPGEREYCFESVVLPVAVKKKMGILAMKVFAQGKLFGNAPTKADAQQLLRYAWSLPIAAAVIGMHTTDLIKQNVELARAFEPMPPEEMKAMSERLAPANKVALDRYFSCHADC